MEGVEGPMAKQIGREQIKHQAHKQTTRKQKKQNTGNNNHHLDYGPSQTSS